VDDVDRCDITKLVKIIDGLRIILDNEKIHKRLIIITAIDESILKKSIQEKYNCDGDRLDDIFQEYLEKIFIVGIKLGSLENHESKEYLSKLIEANEELVASFHDFDSAGDDVEEEEGVEENERIERLNSNVVSETGIENKEYELSDKEKGYLLTSINQLNNITPRKIRIFYYKYLILKKVFNVRLAEKGLLSEWSENSNEKIIMNLLIHISNNKNSDGHSTDELNEKIKAELLYSANMLSVL